MAPEPDGLRSGPAVVQVRLLPDEHAILAGVSKGIQIAEHSAPNAHVLDIEFAYVIFSDDRESSRQALIDYMEANSIFPAGRYGRWEYHSMEDSILSGTAAAEAVQVKICANALVARPTL